MLNRSNNFSRVRYGDVTVAINALTKSAVKRAAIRNSRRCESPRWRERHHGRITEGPMEGPWKIQRAGVTGTVARNATRSNAYANRRACWAKATISVGRDNGPMSSKKHLHRDTWRACEGAANKNRGHREPRIVKEQLFAARSAFDDHD